MSKETTITTGLVRISFEHLLKPVARNEGDEPKYSATILVPKTDKATVAIMKNAIEKATQEGVAKWGGKRPALVPNPVHDGDGTRPSDGEPFGPECKGMWVFTASCKESRPPFVVDKQRSPIINSTEIYSGMWGRVNVNFYPYNFNGKKGIGAGLNGFQKLRDDEALGGGRVSAEEAFKDDVEIDPITGELIQASETPMNDDGTIRF